MPRRVAQLASLAAAAWLATGCGTREPPSFDVLPSAPPDGWAQLRVLHVADDVESVDVYFRDLSDPMLTSLSEDFAQGFLEVAAGDYTIDLRPAGASLHSEPTASFDESLANRERATLVLMNGGVVLHITDDLGRVDAGALRPVNASSESLSFDFGAASASVTVLPSGEVGRATLNTTAEATVTISGASGAQTYVLPERPLVGDVLVVASDTTTLMLTYSFTVTTLRAP